MEEKKQTKIEKEKRKWFQIIGPKIFGGRLLGETTGESIDKINGRKLGLSAGMIAGDIKKQYVTLIFNLSGGDNNSVNASIIGLKMSSSYLKRGMKRFKSKLEDSFIVKCVDCNIRMKVLLLLRKKIHKAVSSNLLKSCKEASNKLVEGKKLEELVIAILNDVLSKQIKDNLKKVYPVAGVEIRYFCRSK